MTPPGDLLARVRSRLLAARTSTSRAIDREADWFANNPEYIERVFTRAAPYLHYIVGRSGAARHAAASWRCCRSSRAPSSPMPIRGPGPLACGSSSPPPAAKFGLKQDWWYDGRRDVVAATQAALDYLQYLHDMFDGDWLLAIAAYNCGEGNVSRAVRRNRAARATISGT